MKTFAEEVKTTIQYWFATGKQTIAYDGDFAKISIEALSDRYIVNIKEANCNDKIVDGLEILLEKIESANDMIDAVKEEIEMHLAHYHMLLDEF